MSEHDAGEAPVFAGHDDAGFVEALSRQAGNAMSEQEAVTRIRDMIHFFADDADGGGGSGVSDDDVRALWWAIVEIARLRRGK